MKVTIRTLTCKRCGHKWMPRTEDVRQCPSCKTLFWDTVRKKAKR